MRTAASYRYCKVRAHLPREMIARQRSRAARDPPPNVAVRPSFASSPASPAHLKLARNARLIMPYSCHSRDA